MNAAEAAVAEHLAETKHTKGAAAALELAQLYVQALELKDRREVDAVTRRIAARFPRSGRG
jgi:hypothetical protein